MRGRGGGIAGNPVLIGAATVLVILVAVFLSYNANKGLPFVPTYQVDAEMPSAAQLVVGNDVKIGGSRVGAVTAIHPKQLDNGRVIAVLTLTLDKDAGPLPQDSTLLVRPRSALGLKYVEITRGKSRQGYQDGDTIALKQAKTPVELDEFLNMFDEDTRAASQANLEGFGTAFAGRGESINTAIGAFRPLLRDIQPVMANLSDPRTNLDAVRDLARDHGLDRRARRGDAGVAVPQPGHDDGRARRGRAARTSRTRSPTRKPALDAGIEGIPRQRPFLANTEGLMRELQPGIRALRTAAPALSDALGAGIDVLPKTPPLNQRLESLLQELQTFSNDPLVPRGIKSTDQLVKSVDPVLDFLAPTQTVCNYVTLFFRNISSLLSEGDKNGTWQRFIIVTTPQGPNNEGGPSLGPGQRAVGGQPPAHQPVPEHGRARASRRSARPGNEPYLSGRRRHRQRAGHAAGAHRGLPGGTATDGPRQPPQPAPLERLHRADGRDRGRR